MENTYRKIISLSEIFSTNDYAMKLARQGEPSGTVVEAKTQSGGRGRMGKEWLSPPGTGLYFSLILRPVLPPADLAKITLAAGLGVANAIEKICNVTIMLKWPNDLILGGKKVGGILCESGPVFHHEDTVIIVGIGVNVTTSRSAFPEDLRRRVTTLSSHTDKPISKKVLMLEMVDQVESKVRHLEDGDFQRVLSQWRAKDCTLGRELDWLAINGKKVRGVSLGPDEEGVLRIRDGSGKIHMVLSGDLSLAPEE